MIATNQQQDYSGLLHLGVAVLLFPLYFIFGAEFKLLMLVYTAFLVFSVNADFYPALLVHFLPGTTVSVFILACCAALALTRYGTLRKYRIQGLFILAFLNLVLLTYFAFQKSIETEETWTEIIVWLSHFLGPFGFFYGVLISQQFDRQILIKLLWVFFFVLLFQASGVYFANLRGIILAMTIFPVILMVDFTRLMRLHIPWLIRVLAIGTIAVLATRLIGLSFIIVAVIGLSLAIIIARQYMAGAITKLPLGRVFGLVAIFLTVYLAGFASQNMLVSRRVMSINEIRSFDDVLPAIEFKAYGDRAPLWAAAWNTIKSECGLMPPLQPVLIGVGQQDGITKEITFGAHNVGLELLRNFGFIAGISGIVVYIVILGMMGRVLVVDNVDPLIFLVGVVLFSIAFVGGLLGHFVLIDSFSFAMFSLGGLIYGHCLKSSTRINAYLRWASIGRFGRLLPKQSH